MPRPLAHAMTRFLGSTSACGRIGRRGTIEVWNGVSVDNEIATQSGYPEMPRAGRSV